MDQNDADVAYANELAAQDREDQLRQLLSYCRTQAVDAATSDPAETRGQRETYTDVADQLAAILDGES
jgi:hypothetical protein